MINISNTRFIEYIVVTKFNTTTMYITATCGKLSGNVVDIRLKKDLVDPDLVKSVKNVASIAGVVESKFDAYLYDYRSKEFYDIDYQMAVTTKDSIVFIEKVLITVNPRNCVDQPSILKVIRDKLQKSILPLRFTWP